MNIVTCAHILLTEHLTKGRLLVHNKQARFEECGAIAKR